MTSLSLRDQQQAALNARYGAKQTPECGPWNETINTLLSHRSVRKYLPTPLPEHTLETLIAAAQSAATSSNLQTWSVIAITDPTRKARLAAVANNQHHVIECPLFLVWVADLSRLERIGEAHKEHLAALDYFDMLVVAMGDAGLAAQNAVVAAQSLGLSTVYIGALRNNVRQVAAELNLPPKAMGVFGLCVGYADPSAVSEVKPRLPQAAIVHHEQYNAQGETELIKEYDVVLDAFSKRNEMDASNWTSRTIKRTRSLASLSGRDKLKESLIALGFDLR